MKKLGGFLLVLVLLLLVSGWLLLGFFDANRLKKPVLSWLNQQTELALEVGSLDFNPLHPYTLLAKDVRLGDWFSAKEVYLELAELSPVRVKLVDLIDPHIALERATEVTLPANLADIQIQELNTDNLSLTLADWQAHDVNLHLSDWQPRKDGQWQLWSALTVSATAGGLSHPLLDASQIELEGNIRGQQLVLGKLQSRLYDGLFDSQLTLNWPMRELSLTKPQLSHNRLQFEHLPDLATDWKIFINRASFSELSLNFPALTANGVSGTLTYGEWQGEGLPEARGQWQAEEAVLDWLRLEQHRGQLLGSRERLGLSLQGRAYQGSVEAELGWFPEQGRLDIDTLQLLNTKLVWLPELSWPLPDIRIHKLNMSQGQLLSADPELPLSIHDWQLFITDLAWAGDQWRPLTEQARLDSNWFELAYDSLIARQTSVAARLTDTRLTLDRLAGQLLEGQLNASGSMAVYPPYKAELELNGQDLDLSRVSRWLQAGQDFSGTLDISAKLTGAPADISGWQGQLTLSGQDIFIEQFNLDGWLRDRLQEDYPSPKQVDPLLAAMALTGGSAFIHQAELAGPINRGRWQLTGSALQTVRHLLAVRGELDLDGAWLLDLGAINDRGCRELAIRLGGRWQSPSLSLYQPPLAEPCKAWYQGHVPYPAAGIPGRLKGALGSGEIGDRE
ncbi:AsmA family protein [Zobellella maritima]|uniref:AsmA-like C-terminal region-containing protein n=1 Tax=Zobellella maritima TaxID=2059725 RepID=UPI000E302DDF|nr:AsmA-like C-terminal region-containing protein [Zobellella maritima]